MCEIIYKYLPQCGKRESLKQTGGEIRLCGLIGLETLLIGYLKQERTRQEFVNSGQSSHC